MSKMCRFSTSIFSPFGLDFGGSWASKMEPSWPKRLRKIDAPAQLDPLKLKVFQKWRLGGLRARFWRPRTWFWRSWNSIWEGSGTIFSRFLARMPRKPRTSKWATEKVFWGHKSPSWAHAWKKFDFERSKNDEETAKKPTWLQVGGPRPSKIEAETRKNRC